MTASIELDLGEQSTVIGYTVLVFEGFGGLLLQCVQIVHIGPVMLSVVEFHKMAANNWLKGAQLVR
mgnify:CR=1 FL=1